MKKNNAGFTLVEFITVMAIMAIAIGVIIVNIGVLGKYRARESSSKITTCITELKVDTLSKAKHDGYMYMLIMKDSDGKYYANTYITDPTTTRVKSVCLGNSAIKYINTEPGSLVETGGTIQDGNSLYIAFSRSSGELIDLTGKTSKLTCIYIETNDRFYKTKIVPKTGKIMSEMQMY